MSWFINYCLSHCMVVVWIEVNSADPQLEFNGLDPWETKDETFYSISKAIQDLQTSLDLWPRPETPAQITKKSSSQAGSSLESTWESLWIRKEDSHSSERGTKKCRTCDGIWNDPHEWAVACQDSVVRVPGVTTALLLSQQLPQGWLLVAKQHCPPPAATQAEPLQPYRGSVNAELTSGLLSSTGRQERNVRDLMPCASSTARVEIYGTWHVKQANISAHVYCTGRLSHTATPASSMDDWKTREGPFQVAKSGKTVVKIRSVLLFLVLIIKCATMGWSLACRSCSSLAVLLRQLWGTECRINTGSTGDPPWQFYWDSFTSM